MLQSGGIAGVLTCDADAADAGELDRARDERRGRTQVHDAAWRRILRLYDRTLAVEPAAELHHGDNRPEAVGVGREATEVGTVVQVELSGSGWLWAGAVCAEAAVTRAITCWRQRGVANLHRVV